MSMWAPRICAICQKRYYVNDDWQSDICPRCDELGLDEDDIPIEEENDWND